jgi:hypothetical protein
MKKSELRQLIKEEISKVLNKGRIKNQYMMEGQEAIKITPLQKKEFLDRIKGYAEDEGEDSAFDNAGNILARVLTDDEVEWIEDIEDFGYNAEEVENYAQDLVSDLLAGV